MIVNTISNSTRVNPLSPRRAAGDGVFSSNVLGYNIVGLRGSLTLADNPWLMLRGGGCELLESASEREINERHCTRRGREVNVDSPALLLLYAV
jgi:hypothetical protein